MKHKRIIRVAIWGSVLVATFIAGRESRSVNDFETGYNTAMSHVSSTIERRMPDLEPFYIMDIGYRFTPRGNGIASIKKVGDENKNHELYVKGIGKVRR